MSPNELLPSVQELPRVDKLRLMQWPAAQLAKEEGVPLLSPELENKPQKVEDRLAEQAGNANPKKRRWRWFVGIYADSPDFEEVVRIGQEWRNADRSLVGTVVGRVQR